jgi:RHS repeat-associated protein
MNIKNTVLGLGRLAGLTGGVLLGWLMLLGTAQAQSWAKIAGEGDSFTVGGTQTVRFGWGSSWVQQSVSGTAECSSDLFGSDPAPGQGKECDILVPSSGATAVSVTSSANPSTVGQSLTLTATLSPSAATGTVRFVSDGVVLGNATLSAGSATLSTNMARSGTHEVVAVYMGDASRSPGASSTLNQVTNGPSGGTWAKVANEDDPYSISGTQIVRFGTGTSWIYLSTSSSASCSWGSFGWEDPSPGNAKECDLWTAGSGGTALPSPPVSPAPVANYEYDAQGNPTKVIQAPGVSGFNFATQSSYDALSRRKDTTDAKSGVTQFGYDGLDRTTSITDPRNLITQYPRNGLGDATSLISPDTGTASHTYDAAGNLLTRTDSRGVLATYSYDPLNRQTGISYTQSGQTTLAYSWVYDQTGAGFSNGIGRLTSTSHPNGSSQYAYDPQGRLLTETQRVNAATGANSSQIASTVSYGYDAAGHVTSITYPSGRMLSITYTGGQPTALSLAKDASSTPTTLLDQIKFAPFGGLLSWNWQMTSGPQANSRVYDTSGRLVRYQLGGFVRDITYDAADRITSYTHYDSLQGATAAATALNQSFGYDELGRLTSITTATASWSIGYDANGNRTSVTLNGTPSTYTTSATSNRLNAITNPARTFGYDNAGNTTSDSTSYTSTYNLAGRLTTLTKAGTTSTYSYDADGKRVRKFASSGSSSTVVFVYDQGGQLLGEYDQSGNALREYVWLDSTPVAMFTPDPTPANPPLVYFIHADHIDTPRVVVDRSDNIRWRWMTEPFGTTAPETNPQSLGTFTLNLRFPGQYADQESGLHYNMARFYGPGEGRYVQSDPIGLDGGINTYAYVGGNPLSGIDPSGLLDSSTYTKPQQTIPRSTPAPGSALPPWLAPAAVGIALACMPANLGPGAACSDDPRLERPECRRCRNNNHPDLYRSGNAQGPKIGPENMRLGKEIAPDGTAMPGLGASTFESRGSGRWWKLPAAYVVPATLCLRHTHGDHWQLEPAVPTSLSNYGAALLSTQPAWIDVGNVK